VANREFKKSGRDAEDIVDQKMILHFTYESRDTVKSFTLFLSVKPFTKLNLAQGETFEIKKKKIKISRRGSRSLDNAEFGHFTLSFCRRRQRNVPRIVTHVHSHRSTYEAFCLATFPLPLPSWFS